MLSTFSNSYYMYFHVTTISNTHMTNAGSEPEINQGGGWVKFQDGPFKSFEICPSEIESGSNFDWNSWNHKAHGSWLATPSIPLISPYNT